MVKQAGNIAVIPARGGSKRLPRKNILEFQGMPLIAWTIRAALDCGLFERVVVSTDDEEIAAISQRHGAEVPFMRDRYADDHAPISLVTLHALDRLEAMDGQRYGTVAQLMANCPLRAAADIRDAFSHFEKAGVPAQISCFRFGWMNPWWAVELDDRGAPRALFADALKQRSQDLPPLYCPSGAIWLARTEALRRHETFYCPGHVFHPLSWESAVDIDDRADLAMARAVYLSRTEQR